MKDNKKILIIEDAPYLQKVLKKAFGKTDFKLLQAFNGIDGYKMAIEEKPDIILLDLILPDMEGMEVLKKIRASKKIPDTRIIIISNLDSTDNMKKALELGVNDYFVKANESFFSVVDMVKKFVNSG